MQLNNNSHTFEKISKSRLLPKCRMKYIMLIQLLKSKCFGFPCYVN